MKYRWFCECKSANCISKEKQHCIPIRKEYEIIGDAADLILDLPKAIVKPTPDTIGSVAFDAACLLLPDGTLNYADEVDDIVDLGKKAGKSGADSFDDIFTAGKKSFDDFNINDAYVKPKHLSTTGGNGRKFIGSSKTEAEDVLKDVLSNGNIVSIKDNGVTKAGNASYEIILDAGKPIGTKGENLVKIILSSDGGMLSAYPTN